MPAVRAYSEVVRAMSGFPRVRKAVAMSVQFFGLRAIVIGSIPVIYWALKWVRGNRSSITDILFLCISYASIAVGVLVWKFVEAKGVLSWEHEVMEKINQLSPQEQSELRRIARAGKAKVGQNVLDTIEAKTGFMTRDMVGYWRIEEEYRPFLKKWAGRQT
ncbi:MAG: hypothetical protein WCF26_21680 [Candidatus Sulfotelmatobacter sp.]